MLCSSLISCQTLRLYATQRLGSLVRSSPTANPWTLRLLLTQLYDPSPDVCSMAVMFLQEACTSREVLQMLVDMQPTIDHLGDIGHPLTLKFMSATLGFRYLYDTGYIDREIDVWFNVGFLLPASPKVRNLTPSAGAQYRLLGASRSVLGSRLQSLGG